MSRILLVSFSSNQSSGVGNRAYYLSRELARLGCDVTLLAPAGQSAPKERNLHFQETSSIRLPTIPPKPLPNVTLFNLQAARRIREMVSDGEPIFVDIQHVHFSPMLVQSRRFMKRSKKQFVALTCQGTEIGLSTLEANQRSFLNRLLVMAEKRTFASSDMIIPSSHFLKDEIVRSYGDLGNVRMEVLHNGIDIAEFLEARNHYRTISGEKKIESKNDSPETGKESAITILYVGGFTFRKGLDVLLKSLRPLRDSFRFKIIVTGPSGSKWARAYLMGMMQELGLSSSAVIYPNVSREEMMRLLQTSDIFVFPSRYEGFGIALLEALASGKPTVASRIDPVMEILGGEESALLVEPGNSRDLTLALGRLMADSELRDKLSKSAFERAQQFDWKRIAFQYKEIVDSVTH
jgi:glycosyltransferase involved in cell wall biosynthesis